MKERTSASIDEKMNRHAYLYCRDIDKFHETYGMYIEKIMQYFNVIVAYTEGNERPTLDVEYRNVPHFTYDECHSVIKDIRYDELIISNQFTILFVTNSIRLERQLFDLFYEFRKRKQDIMSPQVRLENNKLVYHGAIRDKKSSFYINNEMIDTTNYVNRSIFYTKKTDMFFEHVYICKLHTFLEIFENFNDIDFQKYSIAVTPFTKVHMISSNPTYKFVSENINYNSFNMDLYQFNAKHYLKDFNLHGNGKNVLIIEHTILTPDQDCGSKYMFHFIKTLLKLDYNVYFFQTNFNGSATKYIQDLQSRGVFVTLPHHNKWYNSIDLLLKENFNLFNYIFVSRFDKMNLFYNVIRKYNPSAKLCFQTHDLNFLRFERQQQRGLLNIDNDGIDWHRTQELEFIRKCDISILVSDYEYNLLHTTYHIDQKKLFHYPIFFDSIQRKVDYNPLSNNIIFIGSTHTPNVDSILYFIEHYYPKIIEKIPNIMLHIVGSCCKKIDKKYINNYKANIKLHFHVSNSKLENLFSISKLSIIPLLYGAGLKGKVLDSFNNSVPMITSTIGAEGIICSNYESIIILDYEEDYVDKFVRIYKDNDLLRKISQNSKKVFEEKYSCKNSTKYCKELFDKIDQGEEYQAEKSRKICILFQQYDNIIFENLYIYFTNLCCHYDYDMIVINNNSTIHLMSSNKNIIIIEGDNSNFEMSGYQTGINYLHEHDLYKKYDNYILCNDTINTRPPMTFLNKINYQKFRDVIDNDNVCGVVDTFSKEFCLDDFKFNSWIRSNIILFPSCLLSNIKDINIYSEETIYDKDTLKVKVDEELLSRLHAWLADDYYKNTNKKAKLSRIFNEYRLTHNLLKNYTKEVTDLYKM